jgi:hypothetical protein
MPMGTSDPPDFAEWIRGPYQIWWLKQAAPENCGAFDVEFAWVEFT